jgi:uncharacterized protein YhbP (UPF0306 family)
MNMKISKKEKNEIFEFLAKHKLMSLGTYYKLPWAASVYFLFDEEFNFYFLGSPTTLHCRNIAKNPKVSITVADSHQKASDKKKGFQARGVAKKITSILEVKNVLKAWNKRHLDTPPLNFKTFSKVWKSRLHKIELTDMQIFDENQPEESEIRNWKI